jgi:N-acetylmuramoyl-L-alanine amidase
MAKYYVWLDAGHSKATSGKRNTVADPDFFEYEFNNDLAVKLKKRLEAHGITCYLTNTTPNGADISLTKRANTANTKWKALGCPSNAIFVSLHGNASTGAWAKARGVEVYHAGNASAKSKELALLLTNQIYNDIKKIDNGFKNRGRKSANFTVIYKAQMKAVLIEHGFYDNKADLALMQNHRNTFVEADCKAICKYFGIAYKAPSAVVEKPKEPVRNSFLVKIIYNGKEGLNIRKEANTSSQIMGQVFEGQVFTIVEEKNGMGKLKSGVGWISLNSKYVKKI